MWQLRVVLITLMFVAVALYLISLYPMHVAAGCLFIIMVKYVGVK